MSAHSSRKTTDKLLPIIARSAEFLCRESHRGTWLDARTDASCIWGLSNCGLAASHEKFMRYCVGQLLESSTADDDGIYWNAEIWDTATSAAAITAATGPDLQTKLDRVRDWIYEEYSEREKSFRNDPWESLWALYALMCSGKITPRIRRIAEESLLWVLSKRNPEGVLIASHYVGLMLTVVATALGKIRFTDSTRRLLGRIVRDNVAYLEREYARCRRHGSLWTDEPWSIGLILHGLASAGPEYSPLLTDSGFDRHLTRWCDDEWHHSHGWTDVTDTSGLLVGLSEYYLTSRSLPGRADPASRTDIMGNIASRVRYTFKEMPTARMTVYPIWDGRGFKVKRKTCCLIMPFRKKWSARIKKTVRDICANRGYTMVRPDDLSNREVVEGIWKALNEASLVIADCTEGNPNVFYELGIAQTLGKEVIFLAQDASVVPYDIHHQRVVEYALNRARADLKEGINKQLDDIEIGKR